MAKRRQPRRIWTAICSIRGSKNRLVRHVLHHNSSISSQDQSSLQQSPLKSQRDTGELQQRIKRVAMELLGHMARALKMDVDEMRELLGDGVQSMRINYYPTCPEPEKAIGFAPHSDADALTILFQLNQTPGLQIRKEGNWVSIKPLPDAFVVNIGDIMEIVSNGVHKSIEHRVTVNSTERDCPLRIFIAQSLTVF